MWGYPEIYNDLAKPLYTIEISFSSPIFNNLKGNALTISAVFTYEHFKSIIKQENFKSSSV